MRRYEGRKRGEGATNKQKEARASDLCLAERDAKETSPSRMPIDWSGGGRGVRGRVWVTHTHTQPASDKRANN